MTSDATHAELAATAFDAGVPVICQKPLAPTLEDAERMAAAAAAAGVPLLVHENFRWQAPLRDVRAALDGGRIGRPFRACVELACSFPVFDNQPALREAERFILLDLGSHLLDVARFLMGEVERVTCTTARVTPGIRGEDVASVLLDHGAATTLVTLSYASRLEHERFPQTTVRIEAERGSIALGTDQVVRVTTEEGTSAARHDPPRYAWADPAYDLVHASIVPCHENLLGALRGGPPAETTAADNLRTLALVFGAYESARRGETVTPAQTAGVRA